MTMMIQDLGETSHFLLNKKTTTFKDRIQSKDPP